MMIFGLAMISLVSCNQSQEDKVNTLIQESVKKSLSHPESYLAIETVVDSAFAPFDDPDFREKTLEICKMTMENLEYVRKSQEAVQNLNPKDFDLMDDSDKAQYKQYKEMSDLYNGKVDSLSIKIQEKGNNLMKLVGSEYRFIGWKVTHDFCLLNDEGKDAAKRKIFIIDKDKNRILAEYDTDSKDYRLVQIMYQMWINESM